MKKLIKQYMMAIVAVMLVVGFSAFKVVENSSTTPQDGWYELDIASDLPVNYNDQDKQFFTGAIHSDPEGATCSSFNNKKPCAIYLEFTEEYDGPEIDDDVNVSLVLSSNGVSMTTPNGSNSPYSRRTTDSSL